ncbi:MAG TPA: hypothetical protein VMU19_08740, partial [Bryobacteraceae bacterium]|nr:hypothetical protein [Bryobacteraceae bacterium]
MTTGAEHPKSTVEEIALRFRGEMIPITTRFSYFSTLPIAEEDLKQYLNDPIAALPPATVAALPPIGIILAPYLEKGNGKGGDTVVFEHPPETRHIPSSRLALEGMTVLAVAVRDMEMADYHYQFYNAIAAMLADEWQGEVQES